ncbi:hypothetical protein [Phyllobacterium sp. P30BS-XVII]|nr:hypothetical protein [Phyllobacterium sp. P30BS-XVII]MBA8903848.1 hypothetical protein [Phyllobacterium sp. P30BS-XVII]
MLLFCQWNFKEPGRIPAIDQIMDQRLDPFHVIGIADGAAFDFDAIGK